MKIIVFSDSHKDTEQMARIVRQESPDSVIHLGDHVMDAMEINVQFPNIKHHVVTGNCDFSAGHSLEQIINIEGKKFFITHGHRYQVKSTLLLIKERGKKVGADIVLFGHTHKPADMDEGAMKLFNPGHIGRLTHDATPPSYGCIDIQDGQINTRIVKINANPN